MQNSNFVFDASLLSLEKYFKDYYEKNNPSTKREYLDITWSDLYVTEVFKKNPDLSSYQKKLDQLDPKKKYFTLIEMEDGIVNKHDHLDILVFGAGGAGNVAIPYMHRPITKFDIPRTVLASFMGSPATHPIREEILEIFKEEPDFNVQRSISQDMYSYQMSKTIFSLCPRGRGPNSYRLFESLYIGAIPVYITDVFWTPFDNEIDWESFCVLVHSDKLREIPTILRNISSDKIERYRSYGQEVYHSFFLRDKICQKIIDIVNQ